MILWIVQWGEEYSLSSLAKAQVQTGVGRSIACVNGAQLGHKIEETLSILQAPGFVRVLESFGKLWKLIMPFSRVWKVLQNEDVSRWL